MVAGVASPGRDYQSLSQMLTWEPGQTHAQKVSVVVYGDTDFEYNESFTLVVVSLNNKTRINDSYPQSAASRISIVNDDKRPDIVNPPFVPPIPSVSSVLTVQSIVVAEQGANQTSSAHLQLKLNSAQSKPVTLDYTTLAGQARAGSDFVAQRGRITFAPGETEKFVDIAIVGDIVVEATERLSVQFTGDNINFSDSIDATITVQDDDKSMPRPSASVYRQGRWFLDAGDGGNAEVAVDFGLPNDTPLTGDYNGDGHVDLVVIRPNTKNGLLEWHFDYGADGIEDKMPLKKTVLSIGANHNKVDVTVTVVISS